MADTDWTSWSKTRPFTIEALSQFNGIDVDPYTASVGCKICSQLKFSSYGEQNIAHAFGGLQSSSTANIGLGYMPRHIVPLLLKSDNGSTFLAICGALSEYYPLETVRSFFMVLAKKAHLPRDMAPAESQWHRLVAACAGVLATSAFGIVISNYAQVCEATVSSNPAQLVDWVLGLNDKDTKTLSGDGPFLAASAEWLFGRTVAIQTNKGRTGPPEGQAQLTLNSPASDLSTAGRVHWDSVFRTCFGQAWKDLNKETLTAIIASASGMAHNALLQMGRNPKTFFLRHEIGIPNMGGYGVNETIIAWFEELRRLASGIPRFYKAHQNADDMQVEFDKRMRSLESECSCSACGDGSSAICKVSLSEVVVRLGLFVARMVVVANLYPTVSGIQQFYQRLHQDRLKRNSPHVSYSEQFIKDLTQDLPTPFKMLEVACVLFTGTLPGLMPDTQLSLSRNGLYLLITYLKFNPDDAPDTRPAASVQVHNGGFSYHNRFLQKNFYDPGVAHFTLEEAFENIRMRPKEVKQIVKLQDQHTLVSQVNIGQGQEVEAEELGWDIM